MIAQQTRTRAPRNRTLTLSAEEAEILEERLFRLPSGELQVADIENQIINGDILEVLDRLPVGFVDLLIIDPPYNLSKTYNSSTFREKSQVEYELWLDSWFGKLMKTLKPAGSVYVCCDWRCSSSIQRVMEKHLIVRNRITWEREKGRGASKNWKNCSEDIWFGTPGSDYNFDLESVKVRRRVIAPYTNKKGEPKDWQKTDSGNFRLTHPSNLWTDLTVPFWSMPENTDHPTQKPEKLLAKLILASSRKGELVMDPFLGSGTTSVVAEKLGRRHLGIELDSYFSCLGLKRLELARQNPTIQGYNQGIFWERNSSNVSR